MSTSNICIYCRSKIGFAGRNCEICNAGMCIYCLERKKLYIDYMYIPSVKNRIYRCKTHIKEPLRLYTTAVRAADARSSSSEESGGFELF